MEFLKRILDTDPESRITMNEIRGSGWFKQFKMPDDREPGLYPGLQKMPLNEEFLRTLAEEHEFDYDYSVKCLEANRHNHITATYHLISKKQKRT
jgi:5'-AMP-activated protein kinase catalytic alpha subunit